MVVGQVEIEVRQPRTDQRVGGLEPEGAGAALVGGGVVRGDDEPVAQVGGVDADAPAVAADGKGIGQAQIVAAPGVDQVAAEQVAQAEGTVDVEVGGETLVAGGARAGSVDPGFACQERFVGDLEDQVGLTLGGAGGEAAGHGDAGQVVGEQQGAVDGVGVERGAPGLLGTDVAPQLFAGDPGGTAFELDAAEHGFDDLEGDDAVLDVLLREISTHHPAGGAVGFGDGGGRCLQLAVVQRPLEEGGDGGRELLRAEQGVAGEAELLHGDDDAGQGRQGSRGGRFVGGDAPGQLRCPFAFDLLLQGAGVGWGLGQADGCHRHGQRQQEGGNERGFHGGADAGAANRSIRLPKPRRQFARESKQI